MQSGILNLFLFAACVVAAHSRCEYLGERLANVSVSYKNQSLMEIPDGISSQILYLDLGTNFISSIPDGSFRRFPNLTCLDLSFNNLSFVENGSFSNMTSLLFMDLSENSISVIHYGTFTGTVRLQKLVLAGNSFMTFDFTVLSTIHQGLIYLDISANNIERFDNNNNNETFLSLESLLVNDNRLTILSKDLLPNLPALKSLHLKNNLISVIEGHFFSNMTRLETLDISHNKLTQLTSDSCAGLVNLREFNLNYNQLVDIPTSCFRITQTLSKLYVNGNRFETIYPRSFHGLLALSQLDISNCGDLKSFQAEAFEGLENLEGLRLSSNVLITEIGPKIWGNTSMRLTSLELDSNRLLRTVPKSLISGLSHLTKLSLSHLHLRCDCNLRWVKEASESQSDLIVYLNNTSCINPNRPLLVDVEAEAMVCETPFVVSSSVVTLEQDSAQLQVTITNIGLPVITWELPVGETIGSGQYRPAENSTTLVIADTKIISSVLICSLNISNLTTEFYGTYVLIATNMAGNVTQSLVLGHASRVTPEHPFQIQITVALISFVAIVFLFGMVCFINLHHVNGYAFHKLPVVETTEDQKYVDGLATVSAASRCDKAERGDTETILPEAEEKAEKLFQEHDNPVFGVDEQELTKL